MRVRSFRLLLCLVSIWLPALRAQPPGEETTVNVRLVPLGMTGQIRGVGLLRQGEFEELWIPSTHFPEPVEYSGPNPVTLVSLVDTEGGSFPVTVARATVPAEAGEVLLLLTPLPPEAGGLGEEGEASPVEPPTQFGVKVVDFSPGSFPETSFLLWNLTGRPLLGLLGKKPFRAADNQFVLLRPDIDGPRALDAKIMYADDSSRESYSSRKWFLRPGQKKMIVMMSDPENRNAYLLRSIRYPGGAPD